MNGEAPTFGLRRGPVLCLSGGGYKAAVFHLGAVTRLNELGLLAGTETIYGVAGGSILGALLATQIPWPLHGAFRDWPEEIADPVRDICRRRASNRAFLWAVTSSAAAEEAYARELAGWSEGRSDRPLRFVFGGAGMALGEAAAPTATARSELRWELERPPAALAPEPRAVVAAVEAIASDLAPLDEASVALLENRGYLFADAALRAYGGPVGALEPLPPEPPHPGSGSEIGRGAGSWRAPLRLPKLRRRAGELRVTDSALLLRRFRPFLQQDSLEAYPPDPVETIAELSIGQRCNSLHRADGELIASVLPVEGAGRLDLDYLGDFRYADGRPVSDGDYLDETGGSHAVDAGAMRRRRDFAQVAYGRAAACEGQLWLQYWFFYYYSDKGFLKIGRHEGDWEMIQLRIGADGNPEGVTYGCHSHGVQADWEEIERLPAEGVEAPVIYCARGSHACLPRVGTHPGPAVPDHNDGLGWRLRPSLVELSDELPGWARWPGRWGATRRREAFEGDSPHGPVHDPRWQDPAGFHSEARPVAQAPHWKAPAPPTPSLQARLAGDHAILDYRFPGRRRSEAVPARIVAAAVGEGGGVDAVECFLIDGATGDCALPVPPELAVTDIRVAVVSELGTPGLTLTVPVS